MSIKVKILVRPNAITKENVASAAIADLRNVKFTEFCEYLAQDSTVGAADVAGAWCTNTQIRIFAVL